VEGLISIVAHPIGGSRLSTYTSREKIEALL
jgi:hypothetical protein